MYPSVSQGRICSHKITCSHTEIGVGDQIYYLTQSQYSPTGLTSPSAYPTTPGWWKVATEVPVIKSLVWLRLGRTEKETRDKRESNPGLPLPDTSPLGQGGGEGNKSNEREGNKSNEREGNKSNEREGNKSNEREGNKSNEREGNKSNEREGNKSNEREGNKSNEREGNKSNEREGNKSNEREGNKSNEREGNKSNEREGNKSNEREGEGNKSNVREGNKSNEREGNKSNEREGEGNKSNVREGNKSNVREGNKSNVREGNKSNAREGNKSNVREGNKSNVREGNKSNVREGNKSNAREGNKSNACEGYKSNVHLTDRVSTSTTRLTLHKCSSTTSCQRQPGQTPPCRITGAGLGLCLFVCWLLNVPATCECISGTDLLRQFYVLPHWDRSCRSNFPSHPVTVYWHRADQSQRWPYNARRLAG